MILSYYVCVWKEEPKGSSIPYDNMLTINWVELAKVELPLLGDWLGIG